MIIVILTTTIGIVEGVIATIVSSGLVYMVKLLYQLYAPLVVIPIPLIVLIIYIQSRGKKVTQAVTPLLSPKPTKAGKPKPPKKFYVKPVKPNKKVTMRKLALQDIKYDDDAIINAKNKENDDIVKSKLDDIDDFFAYNMTPDDIDNISIRKFKMKKD